MKFVIVIEWLLGLWGAFALYVALVCGIAFFDASTPENLAMFLSVSYTHLTLPTILRV